MLRRERQELCLLGWRRDFFACSSSPALLHLQLGGQQHLAVVGAARKLVLLVLWQCASLTFDHVQVLIPRLQDVVQPLHRILGVRIPPTSPSRRARPDRTCNTPRSVVPSLIPQRLVSPDLRAPQHRVAGLLEISLCLRITAERRLRDLPPLVARY